MYSYEIERLLKIKNYLLSIEEYNNIISSSSQIDHVKYDGENNIFTIWTNDNYTFTFKIKFK